jgi:hypothetical protein
MKIQAIAVTSLASSSPRLGDGPIEICVNALAITAKAPLTIRFPGELLNLA